MVLLGFEQWQRLAREPLDLVGRAPAVVHSRQSGDRVRERRIRLVFRCRRSLGGRLGDRDSARKVGPVQRKHELDLDMEIEPVRTRERQTTIEQHGRRSALTPPEGTPARGAEPVTGGEGQLGVVLPELVEVAGRLLQVVAEQLVQLDELRRRAARASRRSARGDRRGRSSAAPRRPRL